MLDRGYGSNCIPPQKNTLKSKPLERSECDLIWVVVLEKYSRYNEVVGVGPNNKRGKLDTERDTHTGRMACEGTQRETAVPKPRREAWDRLSLLPRKEPVLPTCDLGFLTCRTETKHCCCLNHPACGIFFYFLTTAFEN